MKESNLSVASVGLQRKLSGDDVLMLQAFVQMERDEQHQVVSSTIVGLENYLVGAGKDEREALLSALSLLMGRVDHAIENNRPVVEVLGGVQFLTLRQPRRLNKLLKAAHVQEEEIGWSAPSALVGAPA